MSSRLVAGILAVVVLGGGGVAFVVLRAAGESAERRAQMLRAVDAELGTDLPARDELTRLVEDLRRAIEEDPHPELVRGLARVQLGLGRASSAWETIEGPATRPGADPLDALVGARVLAALHAERGEEAYGAQALALARGAFDALGEPGAAFLAWQCAYRIDDVGAWLELSERLDREVAQSLEGRTARLLGHHLALRLAERLGIEGGVAEFEALAAGEGSGDAQALCRFVLDTRGRGDELTEQALGELDREWGRPPPELLVLLARAELAKADRAAQSGVDAAGRDELETAVEYLDEVLESHPTFVEARHLAALAHYGLSRKTPQIAHARWLLAHASERDTRRPVWARLAE